MVDPNTRQGKRTPVTLKIKFKSETLEQFIERYAVDVSQGGIFIRTKEPLAVGTQMKFEFQLRDASPLIAGEGTVVWTRENDPSRPAIAPGMGVRFDRLADGSQSVLERILAEKAKQAPQRPTTETDEAAAVHRHADARRAGAGPGGAARRREPAAPRDAFSDSSRRRCPSRCRSTPTPTSSPTRRSKRRPRSARSTSCRADRRGPTTSDEHQLAAAGRPTAAATPRSPIASTDRAEPRAARARVDRDSAPGLPSPPEAACGRSRKLLDTSPSPRSRPCRRARSSPRSSSRGRGSACEPTRATGSASSPRQRVGRSRSRSRPPLPRGGARGRRRADRPARMPPPQPRSSAPIVIGILVLRRGRRRRGVVLRAARVDEPPTKPRRRRSPSAGGRRHARRRAPAVAAAAAGSAGGSGSASAALSGAAGSGDAPAGAELVETVIASSVARRTVEIVGTDQTGPAPFTAKLEKDKPYKVRGQRAAASRRSSSTSRAARTRRPRSSSPSRTSIIDRRAIRRAR